MRDSSAISRSFVVSFFTQRHPQTKTNITDRNDGLTDGTKLRSRWDFEELKDFISTNRFLSQAESSERLSRQLLVKLDPTKIWLRKTCIFSYIKIWHKAAQAVDLASLLPLPVALKLVCYTAVLSVVTQCSSPQWGGALRDDTENGCVADYTETCSKFLQRYLKFQTFSLT